MVNASQVNGSDAEEGGEQPEKAPSPEITSGESEVLPESTSPGAEEPVTDAPARPARRSGRVLHAVLLTFVLLVVVAGSIAVWLRHDVILDWVHTRNYTAPQDVVSLADDTAMTPYAKRLFYVNYPAIEDKDAFNRDCPDSSHEVAVLGCYRGNRNGIYLYRVTDARLAGITQVTAAHEMLHQAFDRLSPADKKHVSAMLTDYYEHKLTDKNVQDKIASYKKLEPNDVVNEMHSVFGTEIGTLPPELETYYKQYFTNRSAVVGYRNKYVAAFSERENQVAAYDAQRDSLKKQIDQAQAELSTWEKNLKAQRAQMDGYLSAGEADKYNALVPGFNDQVVAYKAKVTSTNDLINEYNTITDKRNALTAQEQELIKAQDSHASSADAQ